MSRFVLDSCALLAFLQQGAGWEKVRELLKRAEDGSIELHMSSVNLAEVKYLILRRKGDSPETMAALDALPVHFASADAYLPQMIRLKAGHAMSLADCFAAALAQDLGCPLVTSDPEFRAVEESISIEWL